LGVGRRTGCIGAPVVGWVVERLLVRTLQSGTYALCPLSRRWAVNAEPHQSHRWGRKMRKETLLPSPDVSVHSTRGGGQQEHQPWENRGEPLSFPQQGTI